MIDRGCVITRMCLFAREGDAEVVCGPSCVRVHIEVCLCMTFSVSIFVGSGESRMM